MYSTLCFQCGSWPVVSCFRSKPTLSPKSRHGPMSYPKISSMARIARQNNASTSLGLQSSVMCNNGVNIAPMVAGGSLTHYLHITLSNTTVAGWSMKRWPAVILSLGNVGHRHCTWLNWSTNDELSVKHAWRILISGPTDSEMQTATSWRIISSTNAIHWQPEHIRYSHNPITGSTHNR